jgi:hypothetical protein
MDVSIIQPVQEAFRDESFPGRSIRLEVNETARRDFPWGGCGQLPARAYQATTPPARTAESRDAGFMYPGRFGA